MTEPVTIQGELRIPQAFMRGQLMTTIERQLCDYGLLPVQAQSRRWRMDAEHPGGYVLLFTLTLATLPQEEPP